MKKQQDKPWRITKEEYEKRRLALLAELRGRDKVADWASFSTQDAEPGDIVLRTLMTFDPREEGKSYMCFAYSCVHHKLTPDLVDDLIYIHSGLFDYEAWRWDDEVVKMVIAIMNAPSQNEVIAQIAENGIGATDYIRKKLKPMAEKYEKKIHSLMYDMQKTAKAIEIENEKVLKSISKGVYAAKWDMNNERQSLVVKLAQSMHNLRESLRNLMTNRPIVDRLDWKAIAENPGIPEKYIKARKRIAEGGKKP